MTPLISFARVAIRMVRPELLILVVLASVWLSAAVVVGWQMSELSGVNPECFGSVPVGGPQCSVVETRFAGLQVVAQTLFTASAAAPFLVGAVLGAPLVAREVEEGTTQVAWVLARSRTYWLMGKGLPTVGLAIAMLSVIGLASDLLMSQFQAGLDPSFLYYDQRGPSLPIRGLCVVAMAAAIGAIVGRTLPSLLLSVALGAAVVLSIHFGLHQVWKGEAVALTGDALASNHEEWFGALNFGTAFIAPDGRVIIDYERGIPEGSTAAHLLVHPSQFWATAGTEFLVLTVVAGSSAALAALVTARRRAL